MRKYIFSTILLINIASSNNTVGLIANDNNQSFDGYTLFTPNGSTITYLIDNEGSLVHTWESTVESGLSVYLLEDGRILRTAALKHPTDPDDNPTGGFQVFDWDNNLIWEYYYGRQHHDVEMLPNGNVLLVTTDRKSKNSAIAAGRDENSIDANTNNIRSTSIIEVAQSGDSSKIVWQWNAWDHLIQDFDSTKANFGVVEDHPELIDVNYATSQTADWLHTNSVDYNADLDQIILSNRSINEIWIIDHSIDEDSTWAHEGGNSGKGGDLLYRWGNPLAYRAGTENDQKLHRQHDAHWIENGLSGAGNILIFNNGLLGPEYTTIEEIAPPVDTNGNYPLDSGFAYEPAGTVWTFTANTPTEFYSPRWGGSQRLPNGNTLICNAEHGEFFEVNQNDEVVWRYVNPYLPDGIIEQGAELADSLGNWLYQNYVFRCYKYGKDYSAFDNKTLTPTVSIEDDNYIINEFKLFDNYPNPFNPNTNITFNLVEPSFVNLTIYDIVGNEIRTLLNRQMESGIKNISWDSLDNSGNPVSSGMYFYTITTGEAKQTKKMLLLR